MTCSGTAFNFLKTSPSLLNDQIKSCSTTRHEDTWRERKYSSYSFTTSSLDGVVTPRPRFTRGEGPPQPIVQETGWAPLPFCTQKLEEKSFRLCQWSNLDCPIIQPVARLYTDWAIRLPGSHDQIRMFENMNLKCVARSLKASLAASLCDNAMKANGWAVKTYAHTQRTVM
jgi:hypothetical protein